MIYKKAKKGAKSRKKIGLPFCALLIALCSGCSSVPVTADEEKNSTYTEAFCVNLAMDVNPQMLSPDFWLKDSKNPDKVRMTLSEITLWNELAVNNKKCFLSDLRRADKVITAEEIRSSMYHYNPNASFYEKKVTEKGEFERELKETDWKKFYSLMNFEPLGNFTDFTVKGPFSENKKEFNVEYGICVKRGDLKLVPVDDFYTNETDYYYDDAFQNSGILMNEPVLILWQSKDEQWFFVRTAFCTGWIKKDFIAVCTEDDFYQNFDYPSKNQNSFITVTEDRFVLDSEYFTENGADLCSSEFFMGTYLKTVEWTDEFLKSFPYRVPYSCFMAEIPYRKDDGTLGKSYAAIPCGKASLGLLPYTSRNALLLAYKPLGKRYGWGGMAKERDCSQYLMEIFRCFGFQLPRNSGSQMEVPGKTVLFRDKSASERKKLVTKLKNGALMGFPGHVFMYLGTHNKKNYVISALGSYYPDDLTEERIDANSVSVNTVDVKRKNGKSWLENVYTAKEFFLHGNEKSSYISFNKNWKNGGFSKINSGKAVLYKASGNRKNITVALNAGHGTKGGTSVKTYCHPDRSPKLTGGTTAAGSLESFAISDGMTFEDGKKEAEVNLRTARILRNLLLKNGYDVLMLRENHNTQLDNIARTLISNNYASVHISIHYDGDDLDYDKGAFYCGIPEALYRLKNVKKHAEESERLGFCLVKGLEAKEQKIYQNGRSEVDLTQTSFSTIPTAVLELGNKNSDIDYNSLQIKAEGLLSGINSFFGFQ